MLESWTCRIIRRHQAGPSKDADYRIILTTIPKEKKSEGLPIGPSAWASGLRHIQLPTCLPKMAVPGGTCAESSRSASLTSCTFVPCLCTKILLGLMSRCTCHGLASIERREPRCNINRFSQNEAYLCERYHGHAVLQYLVRYPSRYA